jgi:menaquinone-dependent protoporphyrinogen oxidase
MRDPARVRLLVAYGTRGGSTREVGHRIARVLRARHIQVDVQAAADIQTVCGYSGVIIGSGIYNGSWTPEVIAFVRQHRFVLAHGAVWLFSMAAFGDSHPLIGRLVRREPREIDELTETLRPRSYRVFAGVIDPRGWSRAGRVLLHGFGGRAGDNRNWTEITAWAESIATELMPVASADARCARLGAKSAA